MSDGEFENTGSGASLTVPCQASGIKKNGYMIIKGRPCKVVDTSTSKTGKHGSAKVHFTAIDIFNGKKYEEISPSTHTLQVPIINRQEYTLVDVDQDGFVSLMSADGCTCRFIIDSLKLPAPVSFLFLSSLQPPPRRTSSSPLMSLRFPRRSRMPLKTVPT